MSKMVVVYFKDFGHKKLSVLQKSNTENRQNTENSKKSLIPFQEALLKNLQKRGKSEEIATKEVGMIISAFVNAELNHEKIRDLYEKSRSKQNSDFMFTSEIAAILENYWKVYAPLGYDMMSCINTLTTLTDFLDPQKSESESVIPLNIQPKSPKSKTKFSRNQNLLEIEAEPEQSLSSYLTSIMEQNDVTNDVITLDDSNEVEIVQELTARIISSKLEALKSELEMIKENRYRYEEFRNNKFSLALIAQYARENLRKYTDNAGSWSESEVWDFGEYVISIVAYAGKSHYALKNMYEDGKFKHLEEIIKKSAAFKFVCESFHVDKITDLCSMYFAVGYYQCKIRKNKK